MNKNLHWSHLPALTGEKHRALMGFMTSPNEVKQSWTLTSYFSRYIVLHIEKSSQKCCFIHLHMISIHRNSKNQLSRRLLQDPSGHISHTITAKWKSRMVGAGPENPAVFFTACAMQRRQRVWRVLDGSEEQHMKSTIGKQRHSKSS